MIYTDKDIEVALDAISAYMAERNDAHEEHSINDLADYCVTYGAAYLAYTLGYMSDDELESQRATVTGRWPFVDLPGALPGAEREEVLNDAAD